MKRLFDILFSFLGIIIVSPILLVTAIGIKLDSQGPIFYRQTRVGRFNHDFQILKFRSMYVDSDKHGLITIGGRDPRVTPIGYYIRRFKIDELPQLWNVFIGDMSFVGPRPFILNEKLPDDKIDDSIYTVLPGVVSLAISKGRRDVSHKERLNYDVLYVKNMNLIVDIKIILETIKVIILQNVKR